MLRAYGATDKGRVRPTNEDHFIIDEQLRLLIVADGMGGHNAGEVASHVASDAIFDFIAERNGDADWPFGRDPFLSETGNIVRTAVHIANVRVLEAAGASDEYAGMGTTVVAAMVNGNRLSVASVGDSRLYVIANGRARQITRDDSWMASILATDPHADLAALQHHPMRNALTNVVGGRPSTTVNVIEEELQGGEVLLLTTDGVHGVLEACALERIVRETSELDRAPAAVVTAALATGSRDNCTAIVALYDSN